MGALELLGGTEPQTTQESILNLTSTLVEVVLRSISSSSTGEIHKLCTLLVANYEFVPQEEWVGIMTRKDLYAVMGS